MADVTRDDLRELREDLAEQIRDGFDRTDRVLTGINEHLRQLNGKVATQQAALAVHDSRLDAHGREFRDVKDSIAKSDTGDTRILRWFHVGIFVGGAVLMYAALQVAGRLP